MDFNLDRLRTFIVVARTGNFSATARELGATQPNVGRQMTALEKEVGFPLFSRHSRGIVLTEQGREYYDLCQDIVGQIEQKTNIIKERGSEVRGTLKIVVGVGAGQVILDHLHPFASKHPNLCFKISSITDVFQFKIGDSDVGIVPTFISDPDLVQHHLYDMDLRIYASPSYLEANTWPKTPEELHNHKMIVYNGNTPEITKSLQLHLTGDPNKDSKFKNFIEVDNGLALRKSLINGLGIGSLWYESDLLNQGLLIDVFPDMIGRRIPHYFIYHRRLEGSPKVQAFHEFLKEIVKPFHSMVAPE